MFGIQMSGNGGLLNYNVKGLSIPHWIKKLQKGVEITFSLKTCCGIWLFKSLIKQSS